MPTNLLEQRFERALREAPEDKRAIELCLRRLNESRAHLATLMRNGYVMRLQDKFVLRPRRSRDGKFAGWAVLLQREASGRLSVIGLEEQTIEDDATQTVHADRQGVVVAFPRIGRPTARIQQEECSGDRQGKRQNAEWAVKRESCKWRHPFDSRSG